MTNAQRRIGSVASMVSAATVAWVCFAGPAIAGQPLYVPTSCLTNGVQGTFPDQNLVNAWGIVQPPGGPFWVNTNGTGFSELFDGTGMPLARTEFAEIVEKIKVAFCV